LILRYKVFIISITFFGIIKSADYTGSIAFIDLTMDSASIVQYGELFSSMSSQLQATPQMRVIDPEIVLSVMGQYSELNDPEREIPEREIIISIGQELSADYVMYAGTKVEEYGSILTGEIISTRSGGTISTIQINILDVINALEAESNIASWALIGEDPPYELMQPRRDLFPKHPKDIKEDKTPFGALWRSTVAPGWGQFYSNKRLPGFAFPSIEAVLFGVLFFNFSQYSSAVKNLQESSKLYDKETDPDEVLRLRKETIGYWNAHKSYNKAMINNGIMIGTVWAINAIHAYVAGPRPQKFIHGPEPYSRK
tara:strand:+ start:240 stop:1175 length:936 start_codon:yes stop_codon:yes gene_type:complete